MTAALEIYDTDGNTLLNSQTLVLNTRIKELASRNTGWRYWDNTGSSFNAKTLQNSRGDMTNFMERVSATGFQGHTWFRPSDGSQVLTMGIDQYAVTNNGTFDIAFVSDGRPNVTDKYLSIYNENGDLMWSAGSILKCPIIVEKINIQGKNQVVVDLVKYGKPVNSIYLCTAMFGSVVYGDGGVGTMYGMATRREGNLIYCAPYGYSGSTSYSSYVQNQPYYMYVGYLP